MSAGIMIMLILDMNIIPLAAGRQKGESQEMEWRVSESDKLCLTSIFLCRIRRPRNRG
jgi:hypothetical protein